MLKVYFGLDWDANKSIDDCFENIFEYEWFEDDFVKQMIKGVDDSEVITPHCIRHPIFHEIAPYYLSKEVKTLILMYELDDFYTDLTMCDDSCERWLYKLSKKKDITCCCSGYHITFETLPIEGICLNDNSTFRGSREFVDKCVEFISCSERGTSPDERFIIKNKE